MLLVLLTTKATCGRSRQSYNCWKFFIFFSLRLRCRCRRPNYFLHIMGFSLQDPPFTNIPKLIQYVHLYYYFSVHCRLLHQRNWLERLGSKLMLLQKIILKIARQNHDDMRKICLKFLQISKWAVTYCHFPNICPYIWHVVCVAKAES